MSFSRSSLKNWLVANRVLVAMLFCGVLLPLLIFGALAEDVWEKESLRYDDPLLLWMHNYETPAMNVWMLMWTRLGTPSVMIALGGAITLIFLWKQRRNDAIYFLTSVLGAALLNVVAKAFFTRARPDLWQSIDPRGDFSFPSGHAMGTMALFASLCVVAWHTKGRWPVLIASTIVVFQVGLSRVYIGVHYPSDVLCGWLASLAWVLGLHLIRQARVRRQIA
jgi:undecaprenyl-diphosphatase